MSSNRSPRWLQRFGFAQCLPDSAAKTDLACRNEFESPYPRVFSSM